MKKRLLTTLLLSATGVVNADVSHDTWDGLLKEHVISLHGGQVTPVNSQACQADRSRHRVDGNHLKISSIFKWYKQDVEAGWHGAKSLLQVLVLYSQPLNFTVQQTQALPQGQLKVDFLPYDSNLIKTP